MTSAPDAIGKAMDDAPLRQPSAPHGARSTTPSASATPSVMLALSEDDGVSTGCVSVKAVMLHGWSMHIGRSTR